MMYAIKKNNKFVKDFTDGTKLTTSYLLAEKFLTKKAATIAAQEYGRNNGSGYTVVSIY